MINAKERCNSEAVPRFELRVKVNLLESLIKYVKRKRGLLATPGSSFSRY